MQINELLDKLNPAQKKAASCDASHLLILAGAGSGKTTVLVHRIAWILEQGQITSDNIMAVTFTNKAASELKQRINKITNGKASNMWVGTFHGISHKLLRINYRSANLDPNFQILDTSDQQTIIKRIMLDMGVDIKSTKPKEVQGFINKQKEQGVRCKNVEKMYGGFFKLALEIYTKYEQLCNRDSLVDFTELMLRTVEILQNDESLRNKYQNTIKHLLVDEFQDTNHIQYKWMQLLTGKNSDMTVVGDDDQSIYGWRGAVVENIRDFNKDYKDCETVLLEQNYRSTNNILQAANKVIANNTDRLGKNLWTSSGDGEKISVFSAYNDLEESDFLSKTIKEYLDSGDYSLEDFAILYRSNAISRVVEDGLIKNQIAYKIFGGTRFYDRMEIKNILAYMRMVFNKNDNSALERIINVPPRGIGKQTLEIIRANSASENISLWDSIIQISQSEDYTARVANSLVGFIDCIKKATDKWEEISNTEEHDKMLSEFGEFMLSHSGLREMLKKEKDEKQKLRIENLEEFVNACMDYDLYEKDSMKEFLSSAVLDAGETQAEEGEKFVSLMTMHASKGLEFRVVFIVAMEDGLFPHDMCLNSPDSLEEERRLCYVGITRAKEKLFISHCENRRLHGQFKNNVASRFLKEIPSEVLTYVREIKNNTNYNNTNEVDAIDDFYDSQVDYDPYDDSNNRYKKGMHVNHPTFGNGIITATEENGESMRLQIKFSKISQTKWILASFARLTII